MVKTMKDFISEKQKRESRRKALAERVSNLATDIATFTTEAEAEAAKGNVEGYSTFQRKAEQAQIEAHIAQAQLKALDAPFPIEDVRAAWNKYAEDYGKALARDLKEYKKRKSELEALFRKMVALQNDALHMRQTAAAYAGAHTLNHIPYDTDYSDFAMEFLPSEMGKLDKEMGLFSRDMNERSYIGLILKGHIPQ